MFERAKFYSRQDLGNTMELQRVGIVLDAYKPGLSYNDANDVLELYNAKLFIDNGLALKAWDDTRIASYVSLVSGFGKVMEEMRSPSESWPIPEDAESRKK